MDIEVSESVGATFSNRLIVEARHRTLAIIEDAAVQMIPGISEDEGRRIVKDLFQSYESEKVWHAPQVRFGVNSLRPFGEAGEAGVVLQENDIFFIDVGPVFLGHEGDVGRSFAVGADAEMKKCADDVGKIWQDVRDHWFETEKSGEELYKFAEKVTRDRGWVLNLKKADGHRIADFPHATKMRGSIEALSHKPLPYRWILEIQIQHPTRPFGAFFEDLLF